MAILRVINKTILICFFVFYIVMILSKSMYSIIVLTSMWLLLYFLGRFFKLSDFELFSLLLMFIAGTIGEKFGGSLYFIFPYYDKILHFFIPFFGYLLLRRKIKEFGLNKYASFITFLAIIGIGGLIEIGEYLIDISLHSDMQGVFNLNNEVLINRWSDTMIDMICNFLGSLSGVVITKIRKR